MKKASVTEIKNRLSHYLRLVKQGERIRILDRSVPVAEIRGVTSAASEGDARLLQLQRDGIVTLASGAPYMEFLRRRPAACRVDAAEVLVRERAVR